MDMKKNIGLMGLLATVFFGAQLQGQQAGNGYTVTTTKTITIDKGDAITKRTVEVSTMKTNDAGLYNMAGESANGEMKPLITKTVKIDNDEDDLFDEKIVFSYRAYVPEDFILISDGNDMLVVVDQGEEFSVANNMEFVTKKSSNGIDTYMFKDKNGKEIHFMVQEHITSWDGF
jgi:hypothetical protein